MVKLGNQPIENGGWLELDFQGGFGGIFLGPGLKKGRTDRLPGTKDGGKNC